MTTAEFIVVAASVAAALLFFAALGNALYFHFRFQKKLDQRVLKDQYYDGGFLMGVNRLMLYGHYCLFRKRARRDGVDEVFQNLSAGMKWHMIFHWAAILLGLLLFCIAYFYGRYSGFID